MACIYDFQVPFIDCLRFFLCHVLCLFEDHLATHRTVLSLTVSNVINR
jgi:hypothetical protein